MSVDKVSARILVIDDEVFVRGALSAMLSEQGHLVTEASGAEEALALVSNRDFDLVFTDLAMPKVDGITAAERIKALRPALKIVLMSGYGSDRANERAAESDTIDAIISKPFSLSEIRSMVERMLTK